MSATRSPKVSERVAPKPADPQPKKKKHDEDDGPDFGTLVHAWIESHRASLLDSLRRLGKQPIGSFFTCLVMAVALSLPMGLSLLLNNVERLGGSWQRAAQISLYLNLDTSSKEGEALRDDIKNIPGVAEAEYISRDQALEEFQQQSGLGEALKELPQNPLPGVVLVTPNEVDKPCDVLVGDLLRRGDGRERQRRQDDQPDRWGPHGRDDTPSRGERNALLRRGLREVTPCVAERREAEARRRPRGRRSAQRARRARARHRSPSRSPRHRLRRPLRHPRC